MRSRFFAGVIILGSLCLLTLPLAAHADASIFVLDFNDGTATPDYSFQLNYTGLNLTAADAIDYLASNVKNPSLTDSYQTFNFGSGPQRFYNTFTYAGKTATTASDFSSYWSFWISSDGTNWTEPASIGASSDNLTNGSFFAFSYGLNGGSAPVTPAKLSATVSVAAPEPSAIALVTIGGLGFIPAIRRRRAKA